MSWKNLRNTLMATALGATVLGGAVQAQELSMVEASTDWSVYVDQNPKVCFIVSKPTKTEARRGGKVVQVNRDDIRFYISIIPGQGVNGEPSFDSGYPLKPDGAVKVEIGDKTFAMFPDSGVDKQYAWTNPKDDEALIAAMKRGADAIVTGVSTRGTTTIDTFSLRGFTAAIEKAEELCK